jgi:sirohydrochlorin cobaltochelatase
MSEPKVIMVLAMHGVPPKDMPQAEIGEYMGLRAGAESALGALQGRARQRYEELTTTMLCTERTPENDPFFFAAMELASEIEAQSGFETIVGFNEFCAPTLDDALDRAADKNPERVVVITPMMTRGGDHAEVEIPNSIHRAATRHPGTKIVYAWPFDTTAVAKFLLERAFSVGDP